MERVQAVREERDESAVQAALTDLEQAAAGTDNLVPHVLNCVEA